MVKLKLGELAPDFRGLLGVDGKRHGLEDSKEKKVLALVVSCNHCPTVKAYEERMKEMQRLCGDRGFILVAANPNDAKQYPEDSYENMVKRAKEKGFNFPYLRDEDQNVARGYGATRTPEVFLFDYDRPPRYYGRIDDNVDEPSKVNDHYLRDAVEALLVGRRITTTEMVPIGCTVKWK